MLGHMLYESLRSSFLLFRILAVEVKSTPLRLASVLGRRRRREWTQSVRKAIAHSVVSLDVAGEVCIAGDDHFFASGRFVVPRPLL